MPIKGEGVDRVYYMENNDLTGIIIPRPYTIVGFWWLFFIQKNNIFYMLNRTPILILFQIII